MSNLVRKSWPALLLIMVMVVDLWSDQLANIDIRAEQETVNGKVKTGLEVLLEQPERLKGKRVGLITNSTAITSNYQHALDAMLAKGIQITRVYGPEHGVRGTEQAGTLIDPKTNIPLVNLYGKKPKDMVPLFRDVDILLLIR